MTKGDHYYWFLYDDATLLINHVVEMLDTEKSNLTIGDLFRVVQKLKENDQQAKEAS